MTRRLLPAAALAALALTITMHGAERRYQTTLLWTFAHTTPGQVSEIPAYDPRTRTIWVAGVVGVDVIAIDTGTLVDHIDLTAFGAINSVAIDHGLAAFAIEAPGDRRNAGLVVFYDTKTRQLAAGINQVPVGALPDMLTFTPNGRLLLVANEGTPNAVADTPYTLPDPAGSVSVIDMKTRTVVGQPTFDGVPISGPHVRLPSSAGMDFEPEYIAVSPDGTTAYVTLQEGNAVAELDLKTFAFTRVVGLGAKDFGQPGNEIDPKHNDGVVSFQAVQAKGLYMPDAIAAFQRAGQTYLVTANEGDYREDNLDRSAAGSTYGAVAPLDALRVSNRDSSPGSLFAAGARSFSIWRPDGTLVFDSGNRLEREAHARGLYDDGRSRDKGVEPEGVALLRVGDRLLACIGLERTTSSTVAIYDITDPAKSVFVDLIVTPGALAPEGLHAFQSKGIAYLAIANETVAAGQTSTQTALYRIHRVPRSSPAPAGE